ncbi:carbohydrate kinase family protein [Labrys monachus]|uniref:Sugar/nucleoside kinase (Ribokinase family) n=1 Tax=Labrys monachus TaxID=217067 RepID=A0ABU0FMV3_9HYPH|nr:PfkB family carbohydrate kinase [Labrys monachus]MDQ0395687.1 sugar/nucleoside kinase (ribokinase family) [Labrys monachus]
MTASFAAFGNLSIDDLVFVDGSTRWGVPGGNAMYAALGMAVWGERASIVAPVGPEYPLGPLAGRIDLSRCPALPRTLRNWGLYEEDGSRHFVFRRETRNWADFSPAPSAVATGRQDAAHIAPLPWQHYGGLVGALRDSGTRLISLDLDDRDLAKVGLDEVGALLNSVDLFLPSRQDAEALFPDADPIEAVRRLRAIGPDVALIAVKCGADGVVAHAAGARQGIRLPALPVDVVDATGAGDTFCGGTLVGLARTGDPLEALLFGAVAASFCVEALGSSRLAAATPGEARRRLDALRARAGTYPI